MNQRLLAAFFFIFATIIATAKIQAQQKQTVTLSKALQLAATNNLHIKKAKLELERAEEDHKEKIEQRIPEIGLHGSYARITDLTEYKSGLKDKVVTQMFPDWADATISATLPLYHGNAINNSIEKAIIEDEIALTNIEKQTNDVQIQVIEHYLSTYKLMKLQQLLIRNCADEKERLKEVIAFRKHGLVNNDAVLRIELQLSDRELQLLSNKKNISIGLNRLKTILQIEKADSLELDTLHILQQERKIYDYTYYWNAAQNKEEMRMAKQKNDIRLIEKKMVQANYYPEINLFSSYGFNYPNYLFFPPNPNIYNLGKVGVEAVWNISGLYKNKSKVAIANYRLEEEKLNMAILEDAISDQLYNQYTKYLEIEDQIPVNKKAVLQATENYRIVLLKYKNQLALMTEMIDADNALLYAQFNSISTQIEVLKQYYELQYAAGILQFKE